jgi:hypothetical protein
MSLTTHKLKGVMRRPMTSLSSDCMLAKLSTTQQNGYDFFLRLLELLTRLGHSCLSTWVTPFEVFFGRKPHWLTASLLDVDNNPVDEHGNALPQPKPNSNDETDTEDAEYILTELERSIRQSNA